jgi:hypothetical protein
MRTVINRYGLGVVCTLGITAMELAVSPTWAKTDKENLVEFKKEQVEGEASPDKALIYVMRPANVGFAIKSWFFADDEVLGVNKGNSYFFAHVNPGKHVFWSKSENVDALEMEVKGGEIYYFQQHVQMGWGKARTKIEVVDGEEGRRILAKCPKHSLMTETGRARGQELAAKYREATLKDLERRAREQEEKAAKKETDDSEP